MKPKSLISPAGFSCFTCLLTLTSSLLHAQSTQPPTVPPRDPNPPIEPVDHEHNHPAAERLGMPENIGQVTQALQDLLSASYLTDEERAQLRVKHGLWIQDDLSDPEFKAKAALAVGAFDHESILSEQAHPFERASAHLIGGEPQSAINALDERTGLHPPSYIALRAKAYEMLGRNDEAITELIKLESMLSEDIVKDADELAYAVEGLIQLTRLRGPQGDASNEYKNLAKLLSNARDNIDRLNWRVRLVEAKLLYAHNNYKDAHKAAAETLRLHPRNAQAAFLIAEMAVDSFDFDTAERLATQIDGIAAQFDDPTIEPPEDLASARFKPTLYSSIIHARIALRRKDPVGIEDAIDPMLTRLPQQRDLLELNAAAAAAGFRMSSTQRLLDQYDELSPGSPMAMMRVANTLSEYRQYDLAEPMFNKVIERAPHWGKPRLDLGLMLVQAGKDKLAKSTLTEALDLDPFDVRAQNSLKLVTELATYSVIETDHFIIRYNPELDGVVHEVLAQEMPEVLERIYERVCSDLPGGVDFDPAQKTIIELMPNHEWFAVRIGGMPSIHTMAASTGPVVAIEAPRDGPKSTVGEYDWARVLQHEYTHTANLARTRNRVIHWMTEANAVFNEDAPRSSQTWSLLTSAYEKNELFDLVDINTAFVRPKKPSDRSLAYAQGAWMFEYIIERFGKEAPLLVFDASAAGRSAVDAFDEALGVTPKSFLEEFRIWAKQQLLDRGLLIPDDYPQLTELFDTQDQQTIPTLQEIDELLATYPAHPQLITLKVGIALVGQDTRLDQSAISLLEEAIEIRPTDEAPHRRLARHYLADESLAEQFKAIPYLEYLDAREIHSPAFAGELALLYARSDQPDLAMNKALRAVSIAPYDADQRERAARVALLTNDTKQAIHQLEALTKLEPEREVHKRRLEAVRSMP
jgi:Tetratricopeptide repeat